MVRVDPETKENVTTTCYFNSNLKTIIQKDTIDEEYRVMSNEILEHVANFQRRGSGWIFRKVLSMYIHLNKYEPLKGSSYIPLPKVLLNKGAIINVQNKKDNECFKWAVTSALYPAEKHSERQTKYIENSEKFNWDGIHFPASFKDIDKFEKQNPSISINIFSYEQEVYPLKITKRANDKTVNLLLISKGENQHYCWIKNMSRLITSQISKRSTRRFCCLRCLNSFHTVESLQKHEMYCSNHDVVKVELPNEENNTLSFNNYRSMRVPFVVYADFEAFTQKLDDDKPRDNNYSYTSQYEKHSPSGFCYYIKCSFDESYDQKVMYTKRSEDEDVSQIFVERLEYDIRRLYHRYYKFPKKIFLTKDDIDKFEKATKCHICDKPLGKDRVRDHCHLTDRLVHAFITSHLDYCNCLFAGLPNSHIAPLQRIQNTAARLVTRTKKSEHITPVLQSLNWLPIHQRICFKVLLLVYKIYHKLAPVYLQDLVSFRSASTSSSTRRLRSAATAHLQLCPGPRTVTRYGDRAFSSIAPQLWNNLPVDIRSAPTLDSFKTMLKTHLYNQSYCNT